MNFGKNKQKNNNDYMACPYCHTEINNLDFDYHIGQCGFSDVSMSANGTCEICFQTIDNDTNNEKYIEHLLTNHEEKDIKSKVHDHTILFTLGIKAEIPQIQKPINNNIFGLNNFTAPVNLYKAGAMPANKLGLANNLFKPNKYGKYGSKTKSITKSLIPVPVIKKYNYSLVKCGLCENALLSTSNVFDTSGTKAHYENFHRTTNQNHYFGLNMNFKFDTDTELYQCKSCLVMMENIIEVINYHNIQIHPNSNINPNSNPSLTQQKNEIININNINQINNASSPNKNESKALFCNLCIEELTDDHHYHYSFIRNSNIPSELTEFFNKNKSLNAMGGNLFGGYNNNYDDEENEEGEYSEENDENEDFGDEMEMGYGTGKKKIIKPDIDLKLKELDLFSSVTRPLDPKLDSEFSAKFQPLIFDYVDILGTTQSHYYFKEKKTATATLLKRLKNEFDKFQENLPCNISSSYFIRADMNYPQFIKVLIAGSRGTPYEHGLFEFDIYLPNNYPNGVPKCNLMTTGDGKVRFNPNLYSDGKVCLSLLGTWSGSSIEKWDPKNSSIVQLLLSLSSIVMNDRIIENEPGHGNQMNTIHGIEENEGYANIVRNANITYAMIGMLKKPPQNFSQIIKEYFEFKAKEIFLDIDFWICRIPNSKCLYTGLTSSHNDHLCRIYSKGNNYEKDLKEKIQTLKALLPEALVNEI